MKKPTLAVENVGVKNLSDTGLTVVLGLKVTNPNSFPLKIKSLSYNVDIAEAPLTKGEIENPPEVPAQDSAVIEIPVALQYSDLISSLSDFLGRGTSPYQVRGQVQLGLFNIPFEHKGELQLKGKASN